MTQGGGKGGMHAGAPSSTHCFMIAGNFAYIPDNATTVNAVATRSIITTHRQRHHHSLRGTVDPLIVAVMCTLLTLLYIIFYKKSIKKQKTHFVEHEMGERNDEEQNLVSRERRVPNWY